MSGKRDEFFPNNQHQNDQAAAVARELKMDRNQRGAFKDLLERTQGSVYMSFDQLCELGKEVM